MQSGWNVWEGSVSLVWGAKIAPIEKESEMGGPSALVGRHSKQPTKNTRALQRRDTKGPRPLGRAGGAACDRFGGDRVQMKKKT